MPSGSTGHEGARAPSIRSLATASAVAFGAVALLVVAALILSSTLFHQSIATIVRNARNHAIANEIELSLLTYNRLSHLYVLTGKNEASSGRSDLAVEMQRLIGQAEERATTEEGRQRVAEVSGSLTRYLRDRERLEARGLEAEEINRRVQPALDDAVLSLESLRDFHAAKVERADVQALRMNRVANIVGLSAGVLLLLGLLMIGIGARRYLLKPMLTLHEALARLRAGDAEARVREGGLREAADLAQGFNEMAEALARQRKLQLAFLAGVAHDLKNPLNALKIGIGLLEQERSEDRRKHARSMLDRQVGRLTRMVDDLLDASRIEAGRLEMRNEEVDIREVVEQIVELYAPTAPAHDITTDLPSEPAVVRGDPLRIEQVASNLLSNAIKFSPAGGPIDVTVQRLSGEIELTIADRGVGIPREELPDIFWPFRRQRPDVAPGAGLGLSVVRRIVTAHGGDIAVDSEPGVGSTFRVRLPKVLGGISDQVVEDDGKAKRSSSPAPNGTRPRH